MNWKVLAAWAIGVTQAVVISNWSKSIWLAVVIGFLAGIALFSLALSGDKRKEAPDDVHS